MRYRLNAAKPTGEYDATAIATDRVGNRTAAGPLHIRIDTTAPQAHVTVLTSAATQQVAQAAGSRAGRRSVPGRRLRTHIPRCWARTSTIGGFVTETPDDVVAQTQVAGVAGVEIAFEPLFTQGSTFRNQPLPTSTVLYLPLDESRRTANSDNRFADVSPARQSPLICSEAAYHGAGSPGRSGQALAFDGVDDSLTLTNTATLNGLSNDFTSTRPGSNRIRCRSSAASSASHGQSVNGFGFGTRGKRLLMTTYGIKDYRGTQDVLHPGVWQHVAVHLGRATRRSSTSTGCW